MNDQTLQITDASPATLTAPWWTASRYDGQCREIDVTDVWQEQMDPENERGEVAMAYLWKDPRDDDQYPTLRGISVSDGVAVYYDRLHAMNILGAAAIWHIEQHEWEA